MSNSEKGNMTPEQLPKHQNGCAYMLDNQFRCDCGFDTEQLRAGEFGEDYRRGYNDAVRFYEKHDAAREERIGKAEAEIRELREFTRLTNESIDRAEAALKQRHVELERLKIQAASSNGLLSQERAKMTTARGALVIALAALAATEKGEL